ncbi:MAG: bacillithiol system redox-active protein YtxJ [Flavobacteriales bacterium]|nr:MAG: bacillithiol system redox-active protein YtxJ [Flavobacteriales bacterium]
MNFLKKIFTENKIRRESKKQIPWIPLTSLNQLDEILKDSNEKPIAIFKHSTRCGISRMALRQFEKQLNIEMSSVSLYFLDLLVYREISNEIATRFKVHHQSPQLIILKNGTAIHQSSHHEIDATILVNYI